MKTALMPIYNPLPVSFERGEGCWVIDSDGKKYLDAITGLGVSSLGHSHPAITNAIHEQSKKILHISNGFTISEHEELASELTSLAKMDMAFFCNSGAEANEAALKLARLYGHQKGIDNPNIIVMEKSFHGRTLATLSASGSRKIQAGFEPLVGGFVRAPFNDLSSLRSIAEHGKDIVAIMLEPIIGNGGIIVPDDNYLSEIRQLCDENGWLMILDEVQTGIGKTGAFFAYQHSDITPDVITSAKALGNGIPIAACIARNSIGKLFGPGKHGSTFGGNPFACHVARTVLKTVQEDELVSHAKKMGEYILAHLKENLEQQKGVKEIRGKGLMLGIELDRPCDDIRLLGLQKGIILNVSAEKVIRLFPALIINENEADILVDRVTSCVREFVG